MKQLATVVRENGRLMAEVIRPEACEACHACKYGRTERRLMALPSGDFREGDQVELNLPDGKVGIASLLAYGIPLIG
ncbi:SoxR reducing system RseC family protein, partial [Eubacteriales bacterium OttesenSCG-928-N13]|nr:SoxR reducing system RseC family protein [Eubacteriales bacterium OttesenSCG-928-N13]